MRGPRSPSNRRAREQAWIISWTGRLTGGRSSGLVAALALAALITIAWAETGAEAASPPRITFSVSGDPAGMLYPGGPPREIPLTLRNPTSDTVYVTRLSANVRDSGANGCDAGWFKTSALDVPGEGIAVPPRGSVTLSRAGLRAPTIQMRDSGTDQNACRDAKLALAYSGTAHLAAGDQATAGPGEGGGGDLPFTGMLLAPLAALGALVVLVGLILRGRR
jgi:hypothetical protein